MPHSFSKLPPPGLFKFYIFIKSSIPYALRIQQSTENVVFFKKMGIYVKMTWRGTPPLLKIYSPTTSTPAGIWLQVQIIFAVVLSKVYCWQVMSKNYFFRREQTVRSLIGRHLQEYCFPPMPPEAYIILFSQSRAYLSLQCTCFCQPFFVKKQRLDPFKLEMYRTHFSAFGWLQESFSDPANIFRQLSRSQEEIRWEKFVKKQSPPSPSLPLSDPRRKKPSSFFRVRNFHYSRREGSKGLGVRADGRLSQNYICAKVMTRHSVERRKREREKENSLRQKPS